MLKILIVDDETPIREWMAFCIQKKPEKYEIVGLAHNGKDALELFNSHLPDIVFTDIKMPIMDGLELMKQIKLKKPSTEIVVLTCYSDFEYARQAVKYGATEYILKTELQDKDIVETLEKIESKRADAFKNSGHELSAIQLRREAFIKHLIMQESNIQNISEKTLHEQGIFIKNSSLFAMAVKYTGTSESIDRINGFSELLQNDSINNLLWFSYDKNIFIFLGNLNKTPSYLLQLNILHDFAWNMQRNTQCTIGLSKIYQNLRFLNVAINEAVLQIKNEFYNGKGSINKMNITKKNSECINNIEKLRLKTIEEINQEEPNKVLQTVDKMLTLMEVSKINDIDYLKKVCIEIIESVYKRTPYRNPGTSSVDDIKDEILQTELFQDMKRILLTTIREIIYTQTYTQNSYSNTIIKALEHIRNHYTEPIGLIDIASIVHLNPEYLSRLFKEETGKNFNNYLTEMRLDKAVYLLKNTDMRVSEIAQTVGYPNLSYFSTVFKKHLGISPFDYKNK